MFPVHFTPLPMLSAPPFSSLPNKNTPEGLIGYGEGERMPSGQGREVWAKGLAGTGENFHPLLPLKSLSVSASAASLARYSSGTLVPL